METKAKEFYESQLHDKTSVVGRMDKEEIISLMAAFAESVVKNISSNLPVSGQSELLMDFLKFHYRENPFRKERTNEKDILDYLLKKIHQ